MSEDYINHTAISFLPKTMELTKIHACVYFFFFLTVQGQLKDLIVPWDHLGTRGTFGSFGLCFTSYSICVRISQRPYLTTALLGSV